MGIFGSSHGACLLHHNILLLKAFAIILSLLNSSVVVVVAVSISYRKWQWVHSFYYDDEPCILDESYERKEAYYGVREAIASLTPGHQVGGEGVLLESDFDVNGNPWGYNWMMLNNDEGPDEIFDKAVGDARPDWERKPSSEVYDFDSGNDADVEVASGDNDDIGGDNYLPTIT